MAGIFGNAFGWVQRRFSGGGASDPGIPNAEALIAATEQARLMLTRLVRGEIVDTVYRGPADYDNWTGETWEIRRAYRQLMLKEPNVKAAMWTKIYSVASLDLQVAPANKNRSADRAAAKYVEYALKKIKGGTKKLIESIAAGAMVDGFSVCEKLLASTEPNQEWPSFWTVEGLFPVDTEWVKFDIDRYKRVTVVRPLKGNPGGGFDPKDFVIHAHQSLWGGPFGISDLRAAYRAATLITDAVKFRAMLLENFSGPFLVGKYVRNDASAKKEMMKALREARTLGYVVCREDEEITVLNLATSADEQFKSAIEDYRNEIYTAINGAYKPFTEGKVSHSGDTSVARDITELFEWALATDVATVLTEQVAPDLVVPNFPPGTGIPIVSLSGFDPETTLKRLQVIQTVQQLIGGSVGPNGGKTGVSMAQILDVSRVEPATDASDIAMPMPQGGAAPGGPPGMGGDPSMGGGDPGAMAPPDQGGGPGAGGPPNTDQLTSGLEALLRDPTKSTQQPQQPPATQQMSDLAARYADELIAKLTLKGD